MECHVAPHRSESRTHHCLMGGLRIGRQSRPPRAGAIGPWYRSSADTMGLMPRAESMYLEDGPWSPTMADQPFIARGFHSRRASAPPGRLPPGQYETRDFPVLSAGPTPRTPPSGGDFT